MFRPLFLGTLFLSIILLSPSTAWVFQGVVVADFSKGLDRNGVPSGWELKERHGQADFALIQQGGTHALHLRSQDSSFAFQKRVHVDPDRYPILSWKWKVTRLPEGGDFRSRKTDDQAAQLYVAFANRKVIAYIWDSNAPQDWTGDACSVPFVDIKAVVVRSGPAELGRWITEARDMRRDYGRLFGGEVPRIVGVRIQTNSQHTESSGESFFADVAFLGGPEGIGDRIVANR